MNFEKQNVVMGAEILANSHYVGVPVTLDFTSVSGGIVKAGSPISASGVVANDATALGILLSDVAQERPIGTIVVHGFINVGNAQKHSGVTVAEAAKSAMPMVMFRTI